MVQCGQGKTKQYLCCGTNIKVSQKLGKREKKYCPLSQIIYRSLHPSEIRVGCTDQKARRETNFAKFHSNSCICCSSIIQTLKYLVVLEHIALLKSWTCSTKHTEYSDHCLFSLSNLLRLWFPDSCLQGEGVMLRPAQRSLCLSSVFVFDIYLLGCAGS